MLIVVIGAWCLDPDAVANLGAHFRAEGRCNRTFELNLYHNASGQVRDRADLIILLFIFVYRSGCP